ncbi:Chitinase [Myxococcus hansupus]|uniref:Chitinase n=1 Tax=Pseudomyxococcus hansupus TaxID=1297742 RepID=A0A0H4XP59_9BACT|nr:FG-GAP-like repeat-containing protein [Myxococcus hansupus]AKQ70157.1 Chitinase [Myxococcus hansupus]
MKTFTKHSSHVLSLLLGVLLFSGCINPVDEGERPCPCAGGWTCCVDANLCVADASRCEQLRPPKPPEPTAPSAPLLVTALPAPGLVTLTWFAPARDGGSAITGYDVGVEPLEGGMEVRVDGTSARVTGLRAGGTYRFTVAARNAVGASPVMSVEAVRLPDVPTAPESLTVARGDRQAHISWRAPASDGGSPVLRYVVTAQPSGASVDSEGTSLSATVSGLPNGVASTFTVRAVNAVGTGPVSEASSVVIPAAPPGAPTSVSASPGVRAVSVSWQSPEDTGGLPVSGYLVTASPGGATQQLEGTATVASFTSLLDDTEYTFTLSATNEVGQGLQSRGVTARTHARPGAPISVAAEPGVRTLTVTWQPPESDGRSSLIGYTVEARPSGVRMDVGADLRSSVLEGVPSTKAQTVTVIARNAAGEGPAGAAPAPVKSLPAPVELTQVDAPSEDRGCRPVTYTLRQVDKERADVLVEFDATGSGDFTRATLAGDTLFDFSSGLTALDTSPSGAAHTFRWNRPRDVPGVAPSARLRITAVVPGTSPATRTFTVALAAPAQRCEVNLDANPTRRLRQPYPARTYGTALGDFNRDGKPDIAVLHNSSASDEQAWVLRGQGHGGFTVPNAQVGNRLPGQHMVTADLDQDGNLDLIAVDARSSGTSSLQVLRGQGDGHFHDAVQSSIPYRFNDNSNHALTPPVATDLDGDGTPELVVALTHRIVVMRHTEGGRLTLAFEGEKLSHTPGSTVVAGDFDNDGQRDLMVVGHALQAFYGRGPLTFVSEHIGELADNVRFATAEDFNGDGHLDIAALVVGAGESSIYLLQGDGRGRFAAPLRLHHHTWYGFGETSHLISGDLDGNGTQDLAYVHADADTVTLFHGRGDGTFIIRTLPAGRHPTRLVAADFDGSGKPDLAVLSGIHQTVRVLRDLEAPSASPFGALFVTADFDGDGHDDVASWLGDGIQVHLTRAEGGLVVREPSPLPTGAWLPSKLVTGRFDADATVDLLVLLLQQEEPYGHSLLLLRGNGDGTFRPSEVLPLGSVFTSSSTRGISVGDVDGDGDLDLVVDLSRTENGLSHVDLRLYRNDGLGTFSDGGVVATYSERPQHVLEDLNGDGRADLLVRRSVASTFELIIFEGMAHGALIKRREFAPAGSTPCTGESMAIADLDAPGHLDIVVTCGNVDTLLPILGRGNFDFYVPNSGRWPVGGGYGGSIIARDLDGDGRPELLVTWPERQTVCVLPSWGHIDFGPGSCFGTQNTPNDITLVDIDHDGVPEVLTGPGGVLTPPSRAGSTLLRVR